MVSFNERVGGLRQRADLVKRLLKRCVYEQTASFGRDAEIAQ